MIPENLKGKILENPQNKGGAGVEEKPKEDEEKPEEEKEDEEKPNVYKPIANNSQKAFMFTIITCSCILIYIILWSLYNKKIAFNVYNTTVMEENSFIMQTKSLQALQSLYEDAKYNRFGIREIGLTEEKLVNLRNDDISIDPHQKLDEHASDVPNNLLFEVIVNNSSVDEQNFIQLETRHNLNDIYTNLIQIIAAYNKCNNIYSLAMNGIPFPWTSFIVYIIIILICAAAIFLLAGEYQLGESLENIKRAAYIKELVKELNDGNTISEDDKKYIEEQVENQKNKKEDSSDIKKIVLFITGIIILVAITILFGIIISNEPNAYTSSLYSSRQFRSNECFD